MEDEVGEAVVDRTVRDGQRLPIAEQEARFNRAKLLGLAEHLRRDVYPPRFLEELDMTREEPTEPAPNLKDPLASRVEAESLEGWRKEIKSFLAASGVELRGIPIAPTGVDEVHGRARIPGSSH